MDDFITKAVHDLEIGRINDEQNRQNHRIEALEGRIEVLTELTSAVKVLANNMEALAKEQGKMAARLDDLEAEPAEHWKKVVGYALGAIVAGVIGFLLRGIGI